MISRNNAGLRAITRLKTRLWVQNTAAIRAKLKNMTVSGHMDAPTMGASFFIPSEPFVENVIVCFVADSFVVLLFDLRVDVLCDGNGTMPHTRLGVLRIEVCGVHDTRVGVPKLVSGR